MLSIFSCASWPSVSLLWRNVYLGLLPIFWFCLFFLILSCMSCLCILEINPLSVASFANIFSHSEGCLFILFSFLCCAKASINRGMDKEDVVHIYNGILLSHKKEQNWVICRDMDGPRDCHTEWSKPEREKQISYINTYMWNLKKLVETILFTKRK